MTQPFPCALSFRLTLLLHSSFAMGPKTSPESAVLAKGTKRKGPIITCVLPMPKPYLSCFWFRTAIESAYPSGHTSCRSAVLFAWQVPSHLPVQVQLPSPATTWPKLRRHRHQDQAIRKSFLQLLSHAETSLTTLR